MNSNSICRIFGRSTYSICHFATKKNRVKGFDENSIPVVPGLEVLTVEPRNFKGFTLTFE